MTDCSSCIFTQSVVFIALCFIADYYLPKTFPRTKRLYVCHAFVCEALIFLLAHDGEPEQTFLVVRIITGYFLYSLYLNIFIVEPKPGTMVFYVCYLTIIIWTTVHGFYVDGVMWSICVLQVVEAGTNAKIVLKDSKRGNTQTYFAIDAITTILEIYDVWVFGYHVFSEMFGFPEIPILVQTAILIVWGIIIGNSILSIKSLYSSTLEKLAARYPQNTQSNKVHG